VLRAAEVVAVLGLLKPPPLAVGLDLREENLKKGNLKRAGERRRSEENCIFKSPKLEQI
jgi:hypothetical protein